MINTQTRQLVIRWYNEGKNQQQIAALAACNQSAISRLISKYKKTGDVKNLPRSGRPTPLTKKMMAKLKAQFRREALEANKNYCSINTKRFAELIKEKTHREYSTRHVERVLHKLDFSRITPRPKHILNDPKKVNTFREEFKKNSKQSMWIMKL